MSGWTAAADALGLALIGIAAIMCLSSAIGLLRLPDLYSRMHAATKPQALGMLLMLTGLVLRMRTWAVLDTVVLVALFQLVTIPVSGHLLSRAQYRIGARPPEHDVPAPDGDAGGGAGGRPAGERRGGDTGGARG